MSVNQHLTPGVSVHPENDIMYLTGNEGQNTCVDFSETTPLQRYTTSCIVWLSCAVCYMCSLLYVQSAICAVCYMCSRLYAICAVCYMCSLLYVQSAICAVGYMLYVQSAICAVCYMCSLLYVQSAICAVCYMYSWPFEKETCKCNIVSTTTWCRLDWAPRVCTLVLSTEYLSYLTSVKEHMEF